MQAPRTAVALLLGVLLPTLGLAGVGQAQPAVPGPSPVQGQQNSVQVQGTLDAVDCENGTITVDTTSGSNTMDVAEYGTVLVDGASVPLCSLESYVGQPVNLWLVATGDEFQVARVDVSSSSAGAPAAEPAPAAAAPLPIDGVVLGTVVVGGLDYLLVQGSDGGYYRYPYYGAYYQYYYRPFYHPYVGVVVAAAWPLITIPAVIVGVVLGTVFVDNLAFILTRDSFGHYYRYPYYGPYRAFYGNRPQFAPYHGTGAWNTAPIRQGDPRWDGNRAPGVTGTPNRRPTTTSPTYRGPNTTPTYRGPNNTAPTYRGPNTTPTYRGPSNTSPTYRGPNTTPAYRGPNNTTPTYRGPTTTSPTYRRPNTTTPTYRQPYQTRPTNRGSSPFGGGRSVGSPASRGGGNGGRGSRGCDSRNGQSCGNQR